MLLKARGWLVPRQPRVNDNFCFFQLRGVYEKAEPVPGSFHAAI